MYYRKPQRAFKRLDILLFILACTLLVGCGGTHEYHIQKLTDINFDKELPGTVSLSVAIEPVYTHSIGYHDHKIYVKEAVKKQYEHSLSQCFTGGLQEKPSDINISVTALDTSIFPIAGLIIDVRLFFKVEIFDDKMEKQKSIMVYGFGTGTEGERALEKAVSNSFYQLLPELEELFVR